MKFVLFLDKEKTIKSEDCPAKILGNYVTISIDKPKQIVIFEVESEIELAKFVKSLGGDSYQLIPIVDAKDYEEKIGSSLTRRTYGVVS